jgi:hypothetical protein
MDRGATSKGQEVACWKVIGRGHKGGGKSIQKLINRESLLNQKPNQTPNKILRGHVPRASVEERCARVPSAHNLRQGGDVITDGRMLPRELLDDRQGKLMTSDTEISSSSDGSSRQQAMNKNNPPLETAVKIGSSCHQ